MNIFIDGNENESSKQKERYSFLKKTRITVASIGKYAGTFAKTMMIFCLIGPPIGSLTFMIMNLYILPTPGPMGFGEHRTFIDEVINFFGFLFMFTIPLSYYYCTRLAILCGFVISLAKILTPRQASHLTVAIIAGCIAGLYLAWPEFSRWEWDYHVIAGINGVVTCIVPALCCDYLTRKVTIVV